MQVVLAVAAVLERWSWRVSQQELGRHRRVGDSLWRASQRDMDVLGFTVFVVNSASLIGIAIAALGVWLGHALDNPYLDPVAAMLIGLVPIASAALLARKSVSLDRDQPCGFSFRCGSTGGITLRLGLPGRRGIAITGNSPVSALRKATRSAAWASVRSLFNCVLAMTRTA